FVPELQAPLYALGFARLFQGDFTSAAHLLIPRLESSLRHILKAHGADPTKRRYDASEEDRSLDAIISNHRAELVDILGAPLMEWSGRAPAPPASDAETGRLSNGASPCPTNQPRPLPRWVSILARIRSTLLASIDAARSC